MPRGRVVRAEQGAAVAALLTPGPSETQRKNIRREEFEARARAERILDEARAQADAILVCARADASEAVSAAVRDADERASAQLAARWLALRQNEQEMLEHDADRLVPLAVALAERLLGASLELNPELIAQLARGVIDEARGARRAVVDAHPLDAATLGRHLTHAGLDAKSFEVREDPALARGELRLHTDVGTIDARLATRFDRLADALRSALR